jgi:glycosyltransferase involved in cell wall biosynthesis/Flp pilus assembly protein TadD
MALRLTTTQLEPEPESAQSLETAAQATVLSLVERAGALLRNDEVGDYLALFEAASGLHNEHRRYQARKHLLEQALAVSPTVNERCATAVYLGMATAAITVLEKNPAEPVLLNYAGIAFYELWSLEAARALFQAAKRLDGNLPHLDRNLKELSLRGRSNSVRKPALHPALKQLTRRAVAVARRAKPATGLSLSLCMIVRDEEEMLPRCLDAVAGAVDEIVIVDTGSQDRTIEIAKSFGAKVIEREWTGSFSDARNVSFDAATGDWILYLDADEVLIKDDGDKLRALCGQTWREAFYLVETNFTGSMDAAAAIQHNALRVFRNRPEYRFEGRLHEQIAYALPGYIPERLTETSVRLDHYGYLGVVRDAKDKSRRNLELLQAQQREGAPTPFLHFNLGAEHAAIGELEQALVEFEEAWHLAETTPDGTRLEFLPSLASRTVVSLRNCGRHQDSIDRADFFLERFPGFTDLVYYQGFSALLLNRKDDAIAYFEKAVSMGDAPSRYTALVGAGTYLPRITMAMMHMDQRQPAKALPQIEWCVEHHPDYFAVMEPYAMALLRNGRSGQETVDEVERRLGPLTKTQQFMLGTALFEFGAAAEAEGQFRLVVGAQPHSGPARAALVESLMYQRRYADAASEAAALDPDTPVAMIVLRSELFARLLNGDATGAAGALERAERVGLPQPAQLLYRSWLAQLTGGASTALPAASLPLVGLMLEALLRVHDFDNFGSLLRLYATIEVPERERREHLAQIYMRRGFVKSAAREWMAVCEQQPDARALEGLARVAIANGQLDTARTFVDQGLALDPTNAGLSSLAQTAEAQTAT